jgi:hypothetical protein
MGEAATNASYTGPCPFVDEGEGGWTEGQCNTIWQTRAVTGAISFVGCAFVLAGIWISRRYRNFQQRLITFLSIAALMATFNDFVGEAHSKWSSFLHVQFHFVFSPLVSRSAHYQTCPVSTSPAL